VRHVGDVTLRVVDDGDAENRPHLVEEAVDEVVLAHGHEKEDAWCHR